MFTLLFGWLFLGIGDKIQDSMWNRRIERDRREFENNYGFKTFQ